MTKALGSRVLQVRIVGILSITLLVGAATAACGPIVFLGLVAPHVARFFTGPDYRWIVPYSALIGAVSLIACDVIGRMIARPGEVQASIVLAAVGAPFFIALVRREEAGGRMSAPTKDASGVPPDKSSTTTTPAAADQPSAPDGGAVAGGTFVVRPWATGVGLLLAALALFLFALSISISDFPMSTIDVGRILLGGGTRAENVVVFDTQLPIGLVSLLVGFGLGMSGALTQVIARNPLATPDMLGHHLRCQRGRRRRDRLRIDLGVLAGRPRPGHGGAARGPRHRRGDVCPDLAQGNRPDPAGPGGCRHHLGTAGPDRATCSPAPTSTRCNGPSSGSSGRCPVPAGPRCGHR